jgi:hypothetical protein
LLLEALTRQKYVVEYDNPFTAADLEVNPEASYERELKSGTADTWRRYASAPGEAFQVSVADVAIPDVPFAGVARVGAAGSPAGEGGGGLQPPPVAPPAPPVERMS